MTLYTSNKDTITFGAISGNEENNAQIDWLTYVFYYRVFVLNYNFE